MPSDQNNETYTIVPPYDVQTLSGMIAVGNTRAERIAFMRAMRRLRLAEVDALERLIGIRPTTQQIRALWRNANEADCDE